MDVRQNVQRITEALHEACLRAGRKPETVRLMAVSKFHPVELALEAQEAGLYLFGESRVQEAASKFTEANFGAEKLNGIELHLIGSLQRNKAKKAAALFDCIQSVDRDELLLELGLVTQNRETPLKILLELNAGEAAKSGYPNTDALLHAAETALGFSRLRLAGLMTMAPWTDDDKKVRLAFSNLKKAQTLLQSRFPQADWNCLSMGMSGDFPIAVEEGSTLIRIGTAIFGERSA